MPTLDNMESEKNYVKLLQIAYGKVGKTHYVMQAAKAGFRVLFLDGDRGLATLAQADAETKKRIFYVDCHDDAGKARFALIVNALLSTGNFVWNDTKQQQVTPAQRPDVGDTIWSIQLSKADWRDIVCIDTWTSLAYSYLSDAAGGALNLTQEKIDRGAYASAGNRATWALTLLCQSNILKCHVIVNSHPDEFQKLSNPEGKLKNITETDKIVQWTRTIPASVSKPHGSRMAKHFTDVQWLRINSGRVRQVDGRSFDDEDGGSAFNKLGPMDELSFAELVKLRGGVIPKDVGFSDMITVSTWTEADNESTNKKFTAPPIKQVVTPEAGGKVEKELQPVKEGQLSKGLSVLMNLQAKPK